MPSSNAPALEPAAPELRDPWWKPAARAAWRAAVGLQALAALPFVRRAGGPRVFYGGARAGDVGGPLVKMKRLTQRFPERRFGYNLVYVLSNAAYLPAAVLAALHGRNVPIVHNQDGVFYPAWYAGDWRAENERMARPYHLAEHVFWQSAFCRRSADRFLGPRTGRGEVLYNAVDTRRFVPRLGPREPGPFRFLVTGKLGRHMAYRVACAITGLDLARRRGLDATLTVAGWTEDGARAALDRLAADRGVSDHISWLGRYTQEQAPRVYAAADAYVMMKHNDPCPNAVLEALACGLPVLYSASGGVPELVGDAAGIGLPVPEDWEQVRTPEPGAIAEGMIAIAARRDAMAAAARLRAAERFDIAPWLARHEAVFQALLA